MVSWLAAAAAMTACIISEWVHAARLRRAAHLAFGSEGSPRGWVRLAGPLRMLAAGATAWGLTTLLLLDAASPA
ncbi:MAG: hypothetical protein WEH44_07600, partial [Pirellulaceae bacterium]